LLSVEGINSIAALGYDSPDEIISVFPNPVRTSDAYGSESRKEADKC
jgi:hypothetical protein